MHLVHDQNGTVETGGAAEAPRDETTMHEETQRHRQPLAALLANAGIASEDQLRTAAAEGMQTGERLGEVLLRRGMIDEASLAGLLAQQWDLPFDDGANPPDSQALALLPCEEAARLGACPIGFADGAPVVAIAEPTDDRIKAVGAALEGARLVVVPRTTLESLLGRPVQEPAAEIASTEPPTIDEADRVLDEHAQALLATLDAAASDLAAIREKAERLAATHRHTLEEIAGSRRELEALRAARAEDQATIERLQVQLAEQSQRTASVRTRLAELTDALAES